MTTTVTAADIDRVAADYLPGSPDRSASLAAEAYTSERWFELETHAVFRRSWQFVTHVEQLRDPGSYVAADVAGMPIVCVRDGDTLRAFYNVCRHRAHELLTGTGTTRLITCPYHAWTYGLDGTLRSARLTGSLPDFDTSEICLRPVRIEELHGLVFVNLDPSADTLAGTTGDLVDELRGYAPDLPELTHAHRLTYRIAANWKTVIDNFLECYHCPTAHRDFVSLVDMDSYEVTIHDIHSSHMARAGTKANTAYAVDGATVTDHAVWWLWPNTTLMRYPGRGNFMVWRMEPAGPETTHEVFDFWFETADPTPAELDAIRYIDEVLQVEDIGLVESVQRGLRTPAFRSGRYVVDPELRQGRGSGLSEHAVHHFHGLVIDAYRRGL